VVVMTSTFELLVSELCSLKSTIVLRSLSRNTDTYDLHIML